LAKIGYARTSSVDQDTATQEARLQAVGCEILRKEKVSGKSRAGRDELAAIIEFIRAGDELVVVKLDRLGRSTRDVLNLVHELDQKGAGLRVLEPEFCTSTDTGRILVTVLGMVADMEHGNLRGTEPLGVHLAHPGPVYRRLTTLVDALPFRRLDTGALAFEDEPVLGVGRASVYRVL
jgi:DNA invertase Pin-like site-specific DNA recombinase